MGFGKNAIRGVLLLTFTVFLLTTTVSASAAQTENGRPHVSVERLGFYHDGNSVASAEPGSKIKVKVKLKNVGDVEWMGGMVVSLGGPDFDNSPSFIDWVGTLPPGETRNLSKSFTMPDNRVEILGGRHKHSTRAWHRENCRTVPDWILKSDIGLVPPVENEAGGKVVDIRPMKTVRGYLAGNADGTYFPGDFLTARILAKSDGKRGRAVEDGWKRYDTREEIRSERPWYGENKLVLENKNGGRRGWTENKQEAKRKVSEMLSRPDVVDAGLENFVNRDYDWRPWWVIDGSRENGRWYKHKDQAERKADYYLEHENASNAGVENKLVDNYREWRAWWVDRDWKIELLKLKPEANVYVYSTNFDVEENVEYHPWDLKLKEGKTVTRRVYVKLGVTTDPGRYKVKLEMTPPHEGHYNPYENVKPIEFRGFFKVVEYNPVMRRIPYLCPFWKPRITSWMIQKPNAVVTKYEGSRSENIYWRGWWKLENSSYKGYTRWFRSREKAKNRRQELVGCVAGIVKGTGTETSNIAPKRRTVISGVSLEGSVTKPLHASHMFQRGTIGSGKPAFENTNITPKNIKVNSSGNITLAKRPNGDYYEGGTIVSSVMEVPRQTEDVTPEWVKGKMEADTPGGTHVKVYIRFAESPSDIRHQEWVPATSLKDNEKKGDCAQYRAVLYTEDQSSAPTLKKVKFRVLNAGGGEFYWAQKDWSGGPGHFLPENTSKFVNPKWIQGGYYAYRDPVLYHQGDTILRSSGVPRTGKAKLVPKNPRFRRLGPHSSVLLELKPKELSEDLKEKTSTMKLTPPKSYVRLEDVEFRPGHREANGKKVFVFARKGRRLTYTKVREEPRSSTILRTVTRSGGSSSTRRQRRTIWRATSRGSRQALASLSTRTTSRQIMSRITTA
ncbi:hypothetical protein AKJ41_00770 [candidate division MSBL1 archaeon SCGC-AAA259O05]|uniref:CARDB domain-containing protein n=1 Tax=candidate division MSBL1 archaeon SCGC-AAA259O05 TaxID=1698271 RepID=A0A133V5D3_9EURY|nr:hypothetical protein AKJ41_00770 [candidate division MSBL1 archaeon SCGC-AAA259O05]